MLALFSWLAAGAAVGLAVRILTPDRQYLGLPRAVALGAAGAVLGGLLGSALLGSGDPSGNRGLTVWLVSAIGAGIVPWAYLAYAVRWEVLAVGRSPGEAGDTTVLIRPRDRAFTGPARHASADSAFLGAAPPTTSP